MWIVCVCVCVGQTQKYLSTIYDKMHCFYTFVIFELDPSIFSHFDFLVFFKIYIGLITSLFVILIYTN